METENKPAETKPEANKPEKDKSLINIIAPPSILAEANYFRIGKKCSFKIACGRRGGSGFGSWFAVL